MSVDRLSALRARDDLLWIAASWPRLKARLRPGGGNALTGVCVKGGEDPAPIDLYVSDLLTEVEEKVARFYGQILLDEVDPIHGCEGRCHGSLHHVCEDQGCATTTPTAPADCPRRRDPIATSTMPGLLVEVAVRYGHFTEADDHMALGFCDDAADYRDKVRHALERPAPPTYVGPCRHDGCGGELYLRDGRTDGKCRECGEPFTLGEQMDFVEQAMDSRLMTASEIVSALMVLNLKVPVGTVKSWIHRSRLVEAVPGSGLYRLADAKELAERRHAA